MTPADFADSIRRSILFAPDDVIRSDKPEPNPSQFKLPTVHMNVTRILVARSIAEAEAKKRGLTVTDSERDAQLAHDPNLARFLATDAPPLERLNLTLEDVHNAARQAVLRRKLEDALLADLTLEDAWADYQRTHDRANLLVVSIPNTPSSAEIDRFTADPKNASVISSYFEAQKRRFSTPRLVDTTHLAIPRGADLAPFADALSIAKKRLSQGELAAEIAKDTNLELRPDQTMVQPEDPAAFGAKTGEVGVSIGKPRGSYVWRVDGHIEPPPATLHEARKREVAAELLRTRTITGSGAALFTRAKDALGALTPAQLASPELGRAAVTSALKGSRAAVVLTGPIARDPNGFIPKIGVSKPLMNAAFELTMTDPVTTSAVKGEQLLYAARLLSREVPQREDFDARAEHWLDAYRERLRPVIFERALEQWLQDYGVQMNIQPLRDTFGKIEKPRR
ncbi:MAG: peptidylprolyl isomerase [Myxococcota bacterium]